MCFYLQAVEKKNLKLSNEEKESLIRGLVDPTGTKGKRKWLSYQECWSFFNFDPAFDLAYNRALTQQMGKTFKDSTGKPTKFDKCSASGQHDFILDSLRKTVTVYMKGKMYISCIYYLRALLEATLLLTSFT